MNVGAPKNNKNAEKWTIEEATKFFDEALILSKTETYDFLGEIAYDLDQDKGLFDYLSDKFPDLKTVKNRIKGNCEVNCFRNMKKEKINVATGMINLKSNHGWTDRVSNDITSLGEKINPPIQWVDADPE